MDSREIRTALGKLQAEPDADEAWARVGHDMGVQGNLDPAVLFAPASVVERAATDVLRRANGRPGHVFNLGHGLMPATPLANIERLVDVVHEHSAATRPEAVGV